MIKHKHQFVLSTYDLFGYQYHHLEVDAPITVFIVTVVIVREVAIHSALIVMVMVIDSVAVVVAIVMVIVTAIDSISVMKLLSMFTDVIVVILLLFNVFMNDFNVFMQHPPFVKSP